MIILAFTTLALGPAVPVSVIMMNTIPDLHVTGAGSGGQFFPRWSGRRRMVMRCLPLVPVRWLMAIVEPTIYLTSP